MNSSVTFPSGTVSYIFQTSFADQLQTLDRQNVVLVTNEHIFNIYPQLFHGIRTLIMPPSEISKNIDTIARLTNDLIAMEATRKTMLVGVGGGVVTDITGFLASVYMRGISFGFVPTSLLAMVDAAIGGKNGVNAGLHKNMIGRIAQPDFILFDDSFLATLPHEEWSNGFAEIIKYACIFDAGMYDELQLHDIAWYQNKSDTALRTLIEQCVAWKNKTVLEDEQEKGKRKLLNFGHTAAHAIENMYGLPHGKAVALGMVIASMLSRKVLGLDGAAQHDLERLLARYDLPARYHVDVEKVMELLKMDKKRAGDTIDYILLERIGKAAIHSLSFAVIKNTLEQYESEN